MMHRVFSPMGNDSFIGSPVRTLKSLECTFPKQEERTTRSKHFPCLAVVDPRVRTLASSNARLYYLGAADYVAGAIMPVHDWTRVIAGVFHDFHQTWIPEIKNTLNDEILPEGFYALAEQIAEGPQPDVLALEAVENTIDSGSLSGRPGTAVALADRPPRVEYTEHAEDERYARSATRVSIYHASGDRVVAYIEILSPGNKRSQFELNRFLDKLDEALMRGCHLLVIDPHPPGRHDPNGIHAAFWGRRLSAPRGVTPDRPLGLSAYRADIHPTAYFQPVAVGQPLPEMPLFLTPDMYVNVPLESTYMAAYRGVPKRWKNVIEA